MTPDNHAMAFQGWPGRVLMDTPYAVVAAVLVGRTRAVAMYRSDCAVVRAEFGRIVRLFAGTRIRSPRVTAFRNLKQARQALAAAITREAAARLEVERAPR